MASSTLKFLLGLYPSTEQIEKKRDELIKEFEKLNRVATSDEIVRYEYLDRFVNSSEFADKKRYYQTLVFKNSDEEQKEKEYLRLKNSHDIKFYYKFKSSEPYNLFKSMDGSKEVTDFEAIKTFIESPEYKKVEDYMKDKKKWERTEEFQKLQEYNSLLRSPTYKNYFKFIRAKEFNNFKKLVDSQELKAYQERESFVGSHEFLSAKASKDFKQSDAYRKFLEFNQWKKSSLYKDYFKLAKSDALFDYNKLNNSNELKHFTELEASIPQLNNEKRRIESLRFEQTDEFRKLQEYKRLNASKRIQSYYKTKTSKELIEFNSLEKSNLIPDYEKLEKTILSDEFKKQKAYLLDNKKWEKTDEFRQQSEYLSLKKSANVIWYYKTKDSTKFDELKNWNVAFEDDFNSGSLNRNNWLTRYFWGEVLLHDTYALPGEKHLFTDGKNIEFMGSTLKLITRNEKVNGKEWVPAIGFFPKDFNYTSGLISSGSSFRTKYGKIEAKVKLDGSNGVLHAFWLAGDTIVPQIDIFKCYDNKLFLSTFWGNPADKNGIQRDTASISAKKFAGKFFIFSLEWSPEKMVWKINDLEVKTQTSNIPNEPMYIVMNSGVVSDSPQVPTRMEVDWVRCYHRN
jgi:beta-glucanase (GH16 family)